MRYSKDVISYNGTTSSVASSATVVDILPKNDARLGATIYNDSTSDLILKMGPSASATDFTVKLIADDYFEVPFGYVGLVTGLWEAANGSARVTEFT